MPRHSPLSTSIGSGKSPTTWVQSAGFTTAGGSVHGLGVLELTLVSVQSGSVRPNRAVRKTLFAGSITQACVDGSVTSRCR
jgi:hypothetical protein